MGCGFKVAACCERLHGAPAAVLCVFFFVLQAISMDYFLVHHLGKAHLIWITADAVNGTLLVICIYVAYRRCDIKSISGGSSSTVYAISTVTWLLMSAALVVKVVVIFTQVVSDLEEDDPDFMGPNVLKTTIALSGVVFLCLLVTQHDAPPGTDRRNYIEELTGTVVFDVLDTVDILEVLFDHDKRGVLWDGLEEVILAVAAINLLLPALPLFTLSKTKYGMARLSKRLVYLHRLAMTLAVNVPNLVVRMILWHGFSVGISPFVLKNCILISMTTFVFYEHTKEKYLESLEDEGDDDSGGNYTLKDSPDLNKDPNMCRPPPLHLTPRDEDGGNPRDLNRMSSYSQGRDSLKESSRHRPNDGGDRYSGDFGLESRMVTSFLEHFMKLKNCLPMKRANHTC